VTAVARRRFLDVIGERLQNRQLTSEWMRFLASVRSAPKPKLRAMVVPQELEPSVQAAPPAECEANCAHHRQVRLSWASLAGRTWPEARPLAGHQQPSGLLVSGLGCSDGF
jgi:hypothetical protein